MGPWLCHLPAQGVSVVSSLAPCSVWSQGADPSIGVAVGTAFLFHERVRVIASRCREPEATSGTERTETRTGPSPPPGHRDGRGHSCDAFRACSYASGDKP